MSWYPLEGWWPRTVAWFCRRGFRWAKAYAGRKIVQEEEDRRMGAVLSACWQTGKMVHGHEDDDGNFVVEVDA